MGYPPFLPGLNFPAPRNRLVLRGMLGVRVIQVGKDEEEVRRLKDKHGDPE